MRKGMMKGSGKRGYHNIIGKDPMVHSQSAKGIKQPQKIPQIPKYEGKISDEKYGNRGYGLWKERGKWNEKGWAFSKLSDVQELIEMGASKERLSEEINDVKRILQGKYTELEDGFMIELQPRKRTISIDYTNELSISNAERIKDSLEKRGYKVHETKRMGASGEKYELTMIKD